MTYAFVPHSGQNFESGSSLFPQFVQNLASTFFSPHSAQNLPVFSVPHLEHFQELFCGFSSTTSGVAGASTGTSGFTGV